jgi:hypothetical protein
MRAKRIVGACCLALVSQADDFVNLGFDDPDLSHAAPYRPWWYLGGENYKWVPVEEAFRGWQVSGLSGYDGRVSVEVGFPPVSIERIDSGHWVDVSPDQVPETVFMPAVPRAEFGIAQTGFVPVGSKYLNYYSSAASEGGEANPPPTLIYLDGVLQTPVEVVPMIYALDVAKYAGQEAELKIVFPAARGYLFDIQGFTAVPEPSTCALLAMGMGWLGWVGWRRSSR